MVNSKVSTRLFEFIETVNKDSVDYFIAKTLLDKIDEFPDIMIEEIALKANTTPSSITKFCKKIGYQSFKEMRYDINRYSNEFITNQLDVNSIQNYMDDFHMMELKNDTNIIQKINMEMVQELSLAIKEHKRILILQASYNHNIVSFLSEVLIVHNKSVLSINRSNQDDFILENCKNSDLVILTSLTGDYIQKRYNLLTKIDIPLYVLSGEKIVGYKCIYPDHYHELFNSYYNSQRYIYIIALLINYFLNQ